MADLFDRLYLSSPNDASIGVHYFRAAMGDYATGHSTRQEIIGHWALDAEAQADLNVLCDHVDSLSVLGKAGFLLELHDVLMIAEEGAKYTTKAAFRARLGL